MDSEDQNNYYYKNNAKAKKLPGGKRTQDQIDRDMQLCTNLFLHGNSYRFIADKVNERSRKEGFDYQITHVQVFKHIKELLNQWKKERFENIDQYMSLQLRRLDKMEQEMWEAWEESKKGIQKTKLRGGEIKDSKVTGGSVVFQSLETTTGNPQYMALLLKIQQERAELLGMYLPKKYEFFIQDNSNSNQNGGINYEGIGLPLDVQEKIALEIQKKKSELLRLKSENDGSEE